MTFNYAIYLRTSFTIPLGLVLACTFFATGCNNDEIESTYQPVPPNSINNVLRLATTSSTRDSGLLDELLPLFEEANACRVDVVAVGTGAALRLGEAGDVDVLLVHARRAEEAFMSARHGTRHEELMYNDFVLLGPENDPAQIRGIDPVKALKQIASAKQCFVSRGDDSGTHKRELLLWQQAGGRPEWNSYLEGGQCMGPTLMIANEKRSYVLADMGTYLNFLDKISLVPLVTKSASLRNPYAVIVVNPKKHDRINSRLAEALVSFLISGETQQAIADYQIDGKQLFHPVRLDRN